MWITVTIAVVSGLLASALVNLALFVRTKRLRRASARATGNKPALAH